MPALLQTEEIGSKIQLQEKIAALQQQLRSLLENAQMRVVLPELHDEKTGRVDAQKLADYMGVPLKRLADGLGLPYKTIHRNPAAEAFQAVLKPVKRSLDILDDFFRKPELVRVWLNTPHLDLDGSTALETILNNQAVAVLTILENALAGVPI